MRKGWMPASVLFIALLSACSEDVDKADQLEPSEEPTEEAAEEETDAAPESETEAPEEEAQEDTESGEAAAEPAEEDGKAEEEAPAEEEAQTEEDGTPEEEPAAEEEAEAGDDSVNAAGDKASESEEETNVGLKAYMPDGPMTKTFLQNGEYEATYDIVAVKGNFVQRVITFGDMVTLQVLEWKEGSIAVVYEEYNPKDTSNMLDTFEPVETINVLVDATKGDTDQFQIVDQKATVQSDVQTFDNVIIVRSVSQGGNVITLQSYAPGVGLIDEQIEDNGDNGYEVDSKLTALKK
ncbi:hypothetical protein QRD89_16415 [Halobacillus sp. ACCC02827]|uniref:hypothetical protein n=1 Tax=Halobacillus sp. ACCC02827 TaxID=3052090 RepID=UPI00257124F1|nr:hypothetical protein [Halobacillus sp. ACCC02827]WJE15287.1 hypothetical protein QRD89_16415 [Halobacillus sp. ACCC02827]